MMIKQFKRGDGFGVGYTYTKSDFDRLYGKIGKAVKHTLIGVGVRCPSKIRHR